MDAIAQNVEGRKFIMAAAFQGIGFRLLSFGTMKIYFDMDSSWPQKLLCLGF